MPALLEMARRLRREVGEETLVVGVAQGPMTMAVQLIGVEAALYLAVDDPERFGRLLDLGTAIATRWGLAQIEAGVHLPLVFEPAGSPEVLPPALFQERVAPRLAGIFAAFREAGAITSWLHIAGQALPILPGYPALGAAIGNFDYCVDPLRLLPALADSPLCVDGNIKPLDFVEATPEAIEAESRRLIRLFERRGGFILSSGCEIPPESRPENIAAMVRAAHRPEGDCVLPG